MAELLFEIGVEELPALAIEPASAFMKSFLAEGLQGLRLGYDAITVLGTPRRLVVMVDGLVKEQADVKEEVLGPNVTIAYGADGKLSQAGLGFIKAKGLKETSVYRKTTDKGEVIAAERLLPGRLTKEIIAPLLIDMMRKIPFKKRMRWESSKETFARPIRWLVCLFDGHVVPFDFAGISSCDQSYGHRFMQPEIFTVTGKDHYLRELKDRFVVLDPLEREAIFIKSAEEKLAHIGARFHVDHELMATVRNIVEYPFVIFGRFEGKYLSIPSEILISEMKTHQKCFAVHDEHEKLLPYFICSANVKPFDEEVFAKGNARVLRARFEDGAFYFAEDKKKTLRQHAESLVNLVFERDLGTVAEKSARIEQLALALATTLDFGANDMELIRTAAPIIKADLVTGVVGQFPELQGVMGRIYAEIEGYEPIVCETIETHYWPRFAEDNLPRLRAAAILSIADKLDTLVGIIAIGKKPQGNKDPFALRRAAIGIVRMLIHFGFSIEIDTMVSKALKSFGDRFKNKADDIQKEAKDFIIQRARGLLIEDLSKENKDYAVNFADSVLAVGSSDLVDAFARAHTLYTMRTKNKDDFDSLVQAFKRASNIVKKAESAGDNFILSGKEMLLLLPQEKDLLGAINLTKKSADSEAMKHVGFDVLCSLYLDSFSQVATIKPKLDAFFDNVMVMVDDVNLKKARLALLSEIKNIADKIADFTHL